MNSKHDRNPKDSKNPRNQKNPRKPRNPKNHKNPWNPRNPRNLTNHVFACAQATRGGVSNMVVRASAPTRARALHNRARKLIGAALSARHCVPKMSPMRRASPPLRARALPRRARMLLGAARRLPCENRAPRPSPMRRVSLPPCALERCPVARGVCMAPRADPSANNFIAEVAQLRHRAWRDARSTYGQPPSRDISIVARDPAANNRGARPFLLQANCIPL